jgi:pimeloyl-ACP methyl ester carboxylesterase
VAFFRGCGAQVSGHIIDGAGHAPHIAHPEETGKRIDEFLRALG